MNNKDSECFGGIIAFKNSYHVFKAEKKLSSICAMKTIPGPREISPNCGVALAFDYRFVDQIVQSLKNQALNYEGVFQYEID